MGGVSSQPDEVARTRLRTGVSRLITRLEPVTIVVVVVAAWLASPGPGLRADSLVVTIALLAFVAGGVALRVPRSSPATPLGSLGLLVAGSALLVAVQPSGPGFLGMFTVAAAAPLILGGWRGLACSLAAIVALAIAAVVSGQADQSGLAFTIMGMVAFAALAWFVRRLAERNLQVEALLAERDAARDTEAQTAAREAALAERQRVARELHDVLAHSLSALVLQLDAARLLAEREATSPQLAETIDRAHHLARVGLDESRRSVGMLRGDELIGPERLGALADEFERDSGTACELIVTGIAADLDIDVRLTLFRVAQEALTNIRKHARADRVEMRLHYDEAGTRLSVEDEAVSCEHTMHHPPVAVTAGYGLAGMGERAELLGGAFTAERTNRGFRVELWVPEGRSHTDTASVGTGPE
jgi:signal transduction histidine kinase